MSTPELDLARERRLNEILGQALERTPEEVEPFLRELPGEDQDLVFEVRKLLAAEGHLGSFLEQPAAIVPGFADVTEDLETTTVPIPPWVGPFRVLKTLGEGGMGRVFLAEQTEPVRRKVALKLIRTSLIGPEAAARFSAERQALARLSHPNIAQIFEAGTTDDGFPYFAMEYLPGLPVTEYCDTHRLPLDQRLELFTTICRAVHHAHSKGIIHRDLKPSNLLVAEIDGRPVPKVIDFGIAKALDQPLTDATLYTAQRMIGTPAYMSPEALYLTDDGSDVDTRTDVYALGILLYELVAGARPFETRGASMAQVLRKISEEDALRPNSRFRTFSQDEQLRVAENRQIDLRAFRRRLASDLGWIAMKAIAKRRTDRYPSASELAEDVERHLRDEPVLAGPPTFPYRASKYFVRNRGKLIAAAVVLLLATTAVAIQVRSTLREDRLSELSEQLGREVERIEWSQRVAYQLPKQDLSAEHQRIREQMTRIQGRMKELGAQGSGPGNYALGRGALALQELDSARVFLEQALQAGYDRPEVFLSLGLTLDTLFQRRLEQIDLVSNSRERNRLRQQAETELWKPARDFLLQGAQADTIAPELMEAHMALFDGDWDLAEGKSQEARDRLPWLYETFFLEGRAQRQRAAAALRDNDLDRASSHALQGEKAILEGLEIGRSDPRGFYQLCSLRALRLNLAVRYSLPHPQEIRDSALEACASVREIDPESLPARSLEGTIWVDWGDVQLWDLGEDPTDSFRKAEEHLLEVTEADPDNVDAWRLLGRSKALEATYASRVGENPKPLWEKGLTFLEQVNRRAPDLHASKLVMSRMLSDRAGYKQYRGEDPEADLERAASLLRSILAEDESEPRAWFYLTTTLVFRADYYFHRGIDPLEDLDDAEEAARRTLELDPHLVTVENNRGNIHLLRAKWLYKTGKNPADALDQCLASAQAALAKESKAAFPNFLAGHAYMEWARYRSSRGEDLDSAVRASRAAYAKGLALLPHIPGPRMELAKLALIEGNQRLERGLSPEAAAQEAEQQARKALEADPNRADAHRTIGLASLLRAEDLHRLGKDPRASFAKARQELETALEIDLNQAEAHQAMAQLAWKQLQIAPPASRVGNADDGLREEGLFHAAEALRLDPAQAESLALEGALKGLDPQAAEEAVGLVEEALRRNRHLSRQWQPWLDQHPESPS